MREGCVRGGGGGGGERVEVGLDHYKPWEGDEGQLRGKVGEEGARMQEGEDLSIDTEMFAHQLRTPSGDNWVPTGVWNLCRVWAGRAKPGVLGRPCRRLPAKGVGGQHCRGARGHGGPGGKSGGLEITRRGRGG